MFAGGESLAAGVQCHEFLQVCGMSLPNVMRRGGGGERQGGGRQSLGKNTPMNIRAGWAAPGSTRRHPGPHMQVAAQPPSSLKRGKRKPFPREGVKKTNTQLNRISCLLRACAARTQCRHPSAEQAVQDSEQMQEKTGHLMVPTARLRAEGCWGSHRPGSSSEELVLAPLGNVSPAAAGAGDVTPAVPG